MTRLSVNLNKVALIRNARGSNYPDLVQVAKDCERFGAQGITVHPRPDERHIMYSDLEPLSKAVTTEFNIEGYPNHRFLTMVREIRPHQVTLVPDKPGALTSDHGWDTVRHQEFLTDIIKDLQTFGMRVSLFLDPVEQLVEYAAQAGTDRIELYTGPYAKNYSYSPAKAADKYIYAAAFAKKIGLGVNAGHDLNLENLRYLKQVIPAMDEVSIGHALTVDALYYGLENAIQMYRARLED